MIIWSSGWATRGICTGLIQVLLGRVNFPCHPLATLNPPPLLSCGGGPTGFSSRSSSLSTCSHLVPYLGSMTFHSTVSQIYVPVKKNVKSLHFNEKRWKLWFMVAPMRPFRSGLLGPVYHKAISYHKPVGIKVDSDLKLYCQIRVVVKSSFFQLRQLAKRKPVFSKAALWTIIQSAGCFKSFNRHA